MSSFQDFQMILTFDSTKPYLIKLLSLGAISEHTHMMHTPVHIVYTLRDRVFMTVKEMHAFMASITSTYFTKEVQMITSSVTVFIYAQVNVQTYSILISPKIEMFTDHIQQCSRMGTEPDFKTADLIVPKLGIFILWTVLRT